MFRTGDVLDHANLSSALACSDSRRADCISRRSNRDVNTAIGNARTVAQFGRAIIKCSCSQLKGGRLSRPPTLVFRPLRVDYYGIMKIWR